MRQDQRVTTTARQRRMATAVSLAVSTPSTPSAAAAAVVSIAAMRAKACGERTKYA
jgi:hypothetical protein